MNLSLYIELFLIDDDDYERLAHNVRNLKRSMSVKKVTFEEEDFLQYEAENYDKMTLNHENAMKVSSMRATDRKFRKNENTGFGL